MFKDSNHGNISFSKGNEDTQFAIKSLVYNKLYNIKNKNGNTVKGIDNDLFELIVSNFLLRKNKYLENYIEKLLNSLNKKNVFMFIILVLLGCFIKNQCIY